MWISAPIRQIHTIRGFVLSTSNKVLFVDRYHTHSCLAELVARRMSTVPVVAASAGLEIGKRSALLNNMLLEQGEEEPPATVFTAVSNNHFDLVVTIGVEAQENTILLPGLPPVIRWSDIDASSDSEATLRAIVIRVENLVLHGSFLALVQEHSHLESVIDSLQEGVLAHDLDRRIFLFSRGAEKITNVNKESVIGRDCHDLFMPRLCGEDCTFCDGTIRNKNTDPATYTTQFLGGDGKNRQLQVRRMPLFDNHGKIIGALASFADTTKVLELELRLCEAKSFSGIIGQDHQMQEIFELIRDLADSDFPVVVTGESGTGKELIAAAIHSESRRRDELFVPVNCGALPEGTLESELFGHVKGAFTGAIRDKKGRFELADKGTLFLDEIGDLSLPMQVKILRVLQEGVFEPVGSEYSRTVHVRVICATNRNLKDMVAKGTFREDLYYRLAVVPIELPPLRERRNDIALLAKHFLLKTIEKLNRPPMDFSEEALSILMNYSWPGNVRQLQNAIQFALIKCRTTPVLPVHLPPEILAATYIPLNMPKNPGKVGRKPKLSNEVVERALAKAGGNKAKAARLLGVGRATLYNFINSNELVDMAID